MGKRVFTYSKNSQNTSLSTFRKLKLKIDEFIRRFLLHVLPKRFLKVRYYGIFANTCRKKNIEKAKQLLKEENVAQKQEDIEDGKQVWEKQDTIWTKIMEDIKNHSKFNCPACNNGRLRFAGLVPENQYCNNDFG